MELQNEKKLTPELWDLYNFIKHRSTAGEKTSVKDICDFMPNVYHLNAKESNFSNCPNIYRDIDLLNGSGQLEKIIVKDYNNFHLATREEAEKYRDKLQARSLRLMKKYWIISRKIDKDGQGKLIGTNNKPIDEHSSARRFFETFISEQEQEDIRNESI